MPPKQTLELTDEQIKFFVKKAQKIADDNLDPKLHLPPKIFAFLQPIVNSTCRGCYSCTLIMLGGMPAAMNGAAVLEEWFDSVDDVVSECAVSLTEGTSFRRLGWRCPNRP
jgi:hypothetical protein